MNKNLEDRKIGFSLREFEPSTSVCVKSEKVNSYLKYTFKDINNSSAVCYINPDAIEKINDMVIE